MTAENLPELRLLGLPNLPVVEPGDDIKSMIGDSIEASGAGLQQGDILVVTHKVVSKAEGALVDLNGVTPSQLAVDWATRYGKDPRQVEVVLRQSKRIVRMDRGVIIAETAHGFICANAGVDQSNVATDTVCLLPADPDMSAGAIRDALAVRFGVTPGVILTDSWGRPWRNGIVNYAIGVAGLAPLADYRGMHDPAGYELHVTVIAVADQIASAAELMMNKLDGRPLVLVRGYRPPTATPHGTGKDLLIDPARDMFR